MLFKPFGERLYRLGASLSVVLISSAGLSAPSFAKHKPQISIPGDPCAKMSASLVNRISAMKSLNAAIEKEQSVPDTLAGVFDLMQGKPYVDQSKVQKLAALRREANTINEAMRISGCAAVNIDDEMRKPATSPLPMATKTTKEKEQEQEQEQELEPNVPLRSVR
jgi:hypothetical protein